MRNRFNTTIRYKKIKIQFTLILSALFIIYFVNINGVLAQNLGNTASDIGFISNLNPDQEHTYNDLTHSLRCLVCQNQSIAESNAPLALDLREQVHNQLLDGKSSQEIKQFMVDRYGDFVLYRPPLTVATLLLWLGPALLFLLAAIWLVINIKKHNQIKRPELNDKQRHLAQDLLTKGKPNRNNNA